MHGVSYSEAKPARGFAQKAAGGQSALSYLHSGGFSVSRPGYAPEIAAAMQDATLGRAFAMEYQREKRSHPSLSVELARHNAMAEVVMTHRARFPAGPFTFRTLLDDGAFAEMMVPAADSYRI